MTDISVMMILAGYGVAIMMFVIFYVLVNLRWFIKSVRNIAQPENRGGYTKLVQLGFITVLVLVFVAIVIYYLIFPSTADKVDLVLTVVVGWLGLIIGGFFGEKSMGTISEAFRSNLTSSKEQIEEYEKLIDRYNKVFLDIKKKRL